jgi:hypothetical protein
LYGNQKTAEVVTALPSQDASYLHHHAANSQAIYVNTITAYHGTPSQQQQQHPPHHQPQPRSAASNVIYVNTASVVPASVGQHSHNHFNANPPQPPVKHPGSAGHVPYSPAMHPGYHPHPTPQHPSLSEQPVSARQHSMEQQLSRPTHLFTNSGPPQKLHIGIFQFLLRDFYFIILFYKVCLNKVLNNIVFQICMLCCESHNFRPLNCLEMSC